MVEKIITKDMIREKQRNRDKQGYYYVIDPDTKEVQRVLGRPKPVPKAVIYLPHYEDSLRIEVDLPDGKPDEVQERLEEYKQKFVNWFGGTKETGYTWGNKTRRFVFNKIALKLQNIKVPREENRALKTLFMYKGILEEFKKGETRKNIVKKIAESKKFEFKQIRKTNKISRETGVILQTHRKESTINRDITSLVKVGILKKIGKGKYDVVSEKELELEDIGRAIFHKKE